VQVLTGAGAAAAGQSEAEPASSVSPKEHVPRVPRFSVGMILKSAVLYCPHPIVWVDPFLKL